MRNLPCAILRRDAELQGDEGYRRPVLSQLRSRRHGVAEMDTGLSALAGRLVLRRGASFERVNEDIETRVHRLLHIKKLDAELRGADPPHGGRFDPQR